VTLSGIAATYLRSLEPAQPVLRASAGDSWVAIVFDQAPEELLSPEMPPGCADEGVVICCDPETGTLFLTVTREYEVGWVPSGELCAGPRGGKGVAFVPIPEEVSRELAAKAGVDRCFMLLPESDGTPRVLVNAPSRDSWRWSYCFNEVAQLADPSKTLAAGDASSSAPWLALPGLRRALHGPASPVVLVNHYLNRTPSPPNVIYADPPFCNCTSIKTRRCHPNTRHLFYHDPLDTSAHRWTAIGTCGCPSQPCS
jgi:hypothetical protein